MIRKLLFCLLFIGAVQLANAQDEATNDVDRSLIENQLSFFPNPSKDAVKVMNTSGELIKMSIFNILGDEVLSRQLTKTKTELAIDKLPAGVYIVAFYRGDATITERLIKQ